MHLFSACFSPRQQPVLVANQLVAAPEASPQATTDASNPGPKRVKFQLPESPGITASHAALPPAEPMQAVGEPTSCSYSVAANATHAQGHTLLLLDMDGQHMVWSNCSLSQASIQGNHHLACFTSTAEQGVLASLLGSENMAEAVLHEVSVHGYWKGNVTNLVADALLATHAAQQGGPHDSYTYASDTSTTVGAPALEAESGVVSLPSGVWYQPPASTAGREALAGGSWEQLSWDQRKLASNSRPASSPSFLHGPTRGSTRAEVAPEASSPPRVAKTSRAVRRSKSTHLRTQSASKDLMQVVSECNHAGPSQRVSYSRFSTLLSSLHTQQQADNTEDEADSAKAMRVRKSRSRPPPSSARWSSTTISCAQDLLADPSACMSSPLTFLASDDMLGLQPRRGLASNRRFSQDAGLPVLLRQLASKTTSQLGMEDSLNASMSSASKVSMMLDGDGKLANRLTPFHPSAEDNISSPDGAVTLYPSAPAHLSSQLYTGNTPGQMENAECSDPVGSKSCLPASSSSLQYLEDEVVKHLALPPTINQADAGMDTSHMQAEADADDVYSDGDVPAGAEDAQLVTGSTPQLTVEVAVRSVLAEALPPGSPPLLLVSCTDVTARRAAEQLLMQLTENQLGMVSQMFPLHVIEHLSLPQQEQQDLGLLARQHHDVTILFMDIVNFTGMSKEVKPWQVMKYLNEVFSLLDEVITSHGLHKVETAGDCYIVSGGVLEMGAGGFLQIAETHDPAANARAILACAKDMLHVTHQVPMPHNGSPTHIRIGIHTGDCTSGLIGSRLPKWSLYGDCVNTASRMESTSLPGRIQVTQDTHRLLPEESWQATGGVYVKGKGTMNTYLWVPSTSAEQQQRRDQLADGTLQHSGASISGNDESLRVLLKSAQSQLVSCSSNASFFSAEQTAIKPSCKSDGLLACTSLESHITPVISRGSKQACNSGYPTVTSGDGTYTSMRGADGLRRSVATSGPHERHPSLSGHSSTRVTGIPAGRCASVGFQVSMPGNFNLSNTLNWVTKSQEAIAMRQKQINGRSLDGRAGPKIKAPTGSQDTPTVSVQSATANLASASEQGILALMKMRSVPAVQQDEQKLSFKASDGRGSRGARQSATPSHGSPPKASSIHRRVSMGRGGLGLGSDSSEFSLSVLMSAAAWQAHTTSSPRLQGRLTDGALFLDS